MKEFDSDNELQELDKFFADSLRSASVEPSGDTWAAVERKLDGKPNRRFLFWLIPALMLLVGSLPLAYYLNSKNDNVPPSVLTERKNSEVKGSSSQKTTLKNEETISDKKNEEPETNPSGNSTAETNVALNSTLQKIQLAALKNKSNSFPENVSGLPVRWINARNGLKKYYIEIKPGEKRQLETILSEVQASGYKDAFVVKDEARFEGKTDGILASADLRKINTATPVTNSGNHITPSQNLVKQTGSKNAIAPVAAATPNQNKTFSNEEAREKQSVAKNASAINIIEKAEKNNVANEPAKENPATAEKNAVAVISVKKGSAKSSPEKNLDEKTSPNTNAQKPDPIVVSQPVHQPGISDEGFSKDPGSKTNTVQENSKGDSKNIPASDQHKNMPETSVGVATTTSAPGPEAFSKTDSTSKPKTEIAKTDSDKVKQHPKAIEEEKKDLPFKRFGIYVLGGPEYIQPISSPFTETIPLTYNGQLKFQFSITKRVAVELGVSYLTSNSSSGNDTLIFPKNINYDSYIMSNFGEMKVDPVTLMDGFSPLAPYPNLRVKYSYKTNYSMINIPLIVKFYPVKRDKLSISVMAGINTQKVLSQSATLTFDKESFTNVITYNNLMSTKFNFSLLLGLGCELKMYKNLHLVIEPNFRYGLSNISSSPSVNTRLINFDGNAGFKIIF